MTDPASEPADHSKRPVHCSERDKVFISYSHMDTSWLKKLRTMLNPLERSGRLLLWDDNSIPSGAEWRREIQQALDSSRAAILLVTANFLASDFVMRVELPTFLKAAEAKGLRLFVILVSHCLYDRTPLKDFQLANDPGAPIDTLTPPKQKKVFAGIAREIDDLLATPSPDHPELVSETRHRKSTDTSSRRVTKNFVDFEDQRHLFRKMLEDRPEKCLMFIRAPGGHGKTTLLDILGDHCEQKGIPYCSIEFGQPYDNPHFTLALTLCNRLGVSPRHLAEVLQPLSVDRLQGKTVSQILTGVAATHQSLRERHIKELLENAFRADLGQLVQQRGRLVCFFDRFESISAEEEDWLLGTLLRPVASGSLKGVTIMTAGRRWPKGNRWDWEPNTNLVDGLPKMNSEHIKIYAEKFNVKITDEEARSYWKASAGGVPLYMEMVIHNLRTVSEVGS